WRIHPCTELYASRGKPATCLQPREEPMEQREFAERPEPWENSCMQTHHIQKRWITSLSSLAAVMMLAGNALAQQAPAAATPQAPAAKAAPAAAGSQTAPAAKTSQTT